jgi:hypothetical protein
VLPRTYRKLIVVAPGPDFAAATRIVEAELPVPGPGELLVRNLYAGVNASDPVAASGGYAQAAPPPFEVGVESCGEVVALGAGVEGFAIGEPVSVLGLGGGYAEYRLATAAQATRVARASPELTSLCVAGLTAAIGLHEAGEMASGETLLVTAAAGGVGSYAVQLAKRAGNHVIGTCSDDGKAAWLRQLGCDRAINYRREDLDAVLSREYPQGIDLVFENVGRHTFDTALRHLAVFGRLVCIGAVSEYSSGLSWEVVSQVRVYRALLGRSASLRGCFLPHYPAEVQRRHLQALTDLLAAGAIKAPIDPHEFRGLESVPDAVAHLHSGGNRGKVLIRFN